MANMFRTCNEYCALLQPDIGNKVKANIIYQRGLDFFNHNKISCLDDLIGGVFNWGLSNEGVDFWGNIHYDINAHIINDKNQLEGIDNFI